MIELAHFAQSTYNQRMHRTDRRRLTYVRHALRRAGIRAMFTPDALAIPLTGHRCVFVTHCERKFSCRIMSAALMREAHFEYKQGQLETVLVGVVAVVQMELRT